MTTWRMLHSFRAHFKSVFSSKSTRPGWFVTLLMTKTMHPDQVWPHLKRETGFSCLMDVSVFPLQHLEVFNWSALNLISNKTRCSVSPVAPLWSHRNACCSAAGHWSARPQVLCPGLHGSLDCLPCSLMTLQVLHAANELMDQAIDPNVACRERPIPRVNTAESGSERYTIVQSGEGT